MPADEQLPERPDRPWAHVRDGHLNEPPAPRGHGTCQACGGSPQTFVRVWNPATNESVFLCGPCSADRAITKLCSCCNSAGLLVAPLAQLKGRPYYPGDGDVR